METLRLMQCRKERGSEAVRFAAFFVWEGNYAITAFLIRNVPTEEVSGFMGI